MQALDYAVIAAFLLLVVAIGFVAARRVRGSGDYFVAGGRIPWWLGGISHHVSGHSGVVFVGLAAVAYRHGLSLYLWWAVTIGLACLVGASWFAPRWVRLREALAIESPTEYLVLRYNRPTQQVMAWTGVLLKLLDIGAKWAAIGVLLHGFTGLPVSVGVWLSGLVSLLYITVGGMWADLYTDLLQFAVQVIACVVLLVAVVNHLGGVAGTVETWARLPAANRDWFHEPYTPLFFLGYCCAALLSYNGGTWNLAARYIGAESTVSARRSALLSGALYLGWPLLLFLPMWLAPLILPDLADPSQSYVLLTQRFLPAGLVGLVLASMFAATMAMTTSDTNTISAVLTRDILPTLAPRLRNLSPRMGLRLARVTTLIFTALTLLIGVEAERFGGILGLVITWFGALIGPASVPMLFGLLPAFRGAGSGAAIGSIAAGLAAFVLTNQVFPAPQDVRLLAPVACSFAVFGLAAFLGRHRTLPAPVADLMARLAEPRSLPRP